MACATASPLVAQQPAAPPLPVPAPNLVAPRAGDILVLGGRLFDGVGDALRPNPGLWIRNGMLLSVSANAAVPGDATVIRLDPDQTILPGLFDLHAHYAIDLFGQGRVDEYDVNPVIFLANGVTSTFPAGEVDPEGMQKAREEIDAEVRPGPRIYNSGPYYGTARPGWRNASMTPDSIRKEVDYWATRGIRGVKAKGITMGALDALIDAAHKHGLTVTAHLDSGSGQSVNPADAVMLGIDRIEHFLGGEAIPRSRAAYTSLEALDFTHAPTVAQMRSVIQLYKDHGTNYDATLTAYGYFAPAVDTTVYAYWYPEKDLLTPYARSVVEATLPRRPNEQFARIYKVKQQEVKYFVEQGGEKLLTLGTDHPSWGEWFSGFGSHRELQAWVQAGVPAAVALKAATANASKAIGVGDVLGTIEPGKYADLFVVRGDPLQNIRATRDVELVMKAGRVYDPKALLESVRGKLGPKSEAESEWWKGNVRFGGELGFREPI